MLGRDFWNYSVTVRSPPFVGNDTACGRQLEVAPLIFTVTASGVIDVHKSSSLFFNFLLWLHGIMASPFLTLEFLAIRRRGGAADITGCHGFTEATSSLVADGEMDSCRGPPDSDVRKASSFSFVGLVFFRVPDLRPTWRMEALQDFTRGVHSWKHCLPCMLTANRPRPCSAQFFK